MRQIALILGLLFSISAAAQTTTNTNCNTQGTGGGNSTTNCTSTSTDTTAQRQQDYQAGYALGSALGTGLARVIQNHSQSSWVKKYCAANPGKSWHWTQNGEVTARGTCQDPEIVAASAFMAKHKDYIQEPKNAQAMVGYLEAHNLNPTEEKSYEMAYKDLKKQNQLHLYSN